jgi:hypothetical protein
MVRASTFALDKARATHTHAPSISAASQRLRALNNSWSTAKSHKKIERERKTYQAWLTAVVTIDKIAVQVQVLILSILDGSICRLVGLGARRKLKLGQNLKRCKLDIGGRRRCKLGGRGEVDGEYIGMGRLLPVRNEGRHLHLVV